MRQPEEQVSPVAIGQAAVARMRPRTFGLRRWMPITVALLDVALVYASFAISYYVRYDLKLGPHITDRVPFSQYQPLALILIAVVMPMLFVKGAYRFRMSSDVVDELTTIVSATTISIASIVVVTYMLHAYQYSRGVVIYLWVILILALVAGRMLYRSVQALLYRHGVGVRRLLVVGATDVGKMVMQSVMSRRDLGYQLVGFVAHRGALDGRDFGRFRALGTVEDIPQLVESGSIDEIILAMPASAHEEMAFVLALCERHHVGLKLVPDLFEISLGRVEIDSIAGIPLLDARDKPLRRIARFCKRVIDIVVSLLLLFVTAPLVLLLGLLVKLESPGRAFIRQERIGINGRPFGCLKLRTMYDGAEEMKPNLLTLNETDGPLFKMRNDPRVTKVGRLIRRLSLDELPQVWNVLVGDMSLVGPRPPLPVEVAKYEPHHHRRLEVKPGITGVWQVSGRSDLSFDEMVMMDIYYVDNWSLSLDMTVLLRTVMAVLKRQGAY